MTTTTLPTPIPIALRKRFPDPSPAAKRWADRICVGRFEHGQVRSFASLVARMAEGLEFRGNGGTGGSGKPTTLQPDEAGFLVGALAANPVDIPAELTATGLAWLRKHAAKRLPGFPVERLDSFVRFTYAGEHAPVSPWHSVPVWRVHFSDGGPFLTYAVTSARVGGLTGQAETPGNWHEGAW